MRLISVVYFFLTYQFFGPDRYLRRNLESIRQLLFISVCVWSENAYIYCLVGHNKSLINFTFLENDLDACYWVCGFHEKEFAIVSYKTLLPQPKMSSKHGTRLYFFVQVLFCATQGRSMSTLDLCEPILPQSTVQLISKTI